ncbi:MAG: formate dehydrogenase accessory protein FdhE [Chloroflexota bacterium]|nr:formate dehydrogenase accessory protein FdhE [Chloroflexota bacterium]
MGTLADNAAAERMGKWKDKKGKAPSYLILYRQLLQLDVEEQYQETLKTHVSEFAQRFKSTHSPLKFNDLLPDWEAMESLFWTAGILLDEQLPKKDRELRQPKTYLTEKIARAWYHYSLTPEIVQESGFDVGTLSLCLKSAFHPILARYAEATSPDIDQESWRKPTCPICGGKPDFAFLDKDNGARWLICSRCSAEWLFQRLECPFCGNKEQDSLSYMTDDKEKYRVYTCDKCHKYIKAIDLRQAKEEVLFPIERLLALDLDSQASTAGYNPGWV